jgi:hypothetical protein
MGSVTDLREGERVTYAASCCQSVAIAPPLKIRLFREQCDRVKNALKSDIANLDCVEIGVRDAMKQPKISD